MTEQEAFEAAERYVLGEMDDAERKAFEELMQEDGQLDSLVRDVSLSIKATENKNLIGDLKDIHQELYSQKSKKTNRFLFPAIGIAASIALFVIVRIFLFPGVPQNDELFAKYFEPFPDYLTMRNNQKNDLIIKGMEAYRSGDFQKAILLLTPEDTIGYLRVAPQFYFGVSHLAAGNEKDALKTFRTIMSTNSKYAEPIKWYMALSYLKAGDEKQAAATLQLIKKSSPEFEKAAKLLEELQIPIE